VAFSGRDGTVMLVSAGASSHVDPSSDRAADPVETQVAALLPPAPTGVDETDGRTGADSAGVRDYGLEIFF
jgi:hypothetical protein